MNLIMNDDKLDSQTDIRTFLDGTRKVALQVLVEQRHAWLANTLK